VSGAWVETPLGAFPKPQNVASAEALVMVRPQGIGRVREGEGIEGLVIEARFEGDATRCTVVFKDLDEPLTALISPHAAPPKGATAWFEIDQEHVLIFESAPSDPK
jgi:hypothetical protein